MIRLAKPDQVFKRTVEVPQPQPDGSVKNAFFKAHFLFVAESEVIGKTNREILDLVLVGWEGIKDHEKNPFAYSPENLDAFLDTPYLCRATALAYVDFSSGLPAKNSETLPGTGSNEAAEDETKS